MTGLTYGPVNAGEGVEFTVTFDTSVGRAKGVHNGTLTFHTNDPDETTYTIPLTARLTDEILVDNDNPGFSVASGSTFVYANRDTKYYDGDYRYQPAGAGNNAIEWLFTGLTPDTDYRVWASWTGGEHARAERPVQRGGGGLAGPDRHLQRHRPCWT